MTTQKEKIRTMVSNIYGIQKLRIQAGNRLVASFTGAADISRSLSVKNVKEAQDEKKIEAENAKKIKLIMGEYQRVTDNIADSVKKNPRASQIETAIKQAQSGGEQLQFIGDAYDYQMADTYNALLETEERAVAALTKEVKTHPMWDAFFKDVKGCGPLMAAVCISYFDPYTARHASSFWKYAGLDVVVDADGNIRGKGKWHKVEQEYFDNKTGEIKTKLGLGYNPFLKSKLIGVLGPCIIKQTIRVDKINNTKTATGYGKAYMDYKARLDQREDTKDYKTGHKHNMAMRYMIKQFVRDMWVMWRTVEGLEVSEPYEVAFLGRHHHGYNDAVEKLGKASA